MLKPCFLPKCPNPADRTVAWPNEHGVEVPFDLCRDHGGRVEAARHWLAQVRA